MKKINFKENNCKFLKVHVLSLISFHLFEVPIQNLRTKFEKSKS